MPPLASATHVASFLRPTRKAKTADIERGYCTVKRAGSPSGYARDRAPTSWWNGTSRVAFPVLRYAPRRARRGRTGTAQNQVVLRIDGHSASQRLSSQIAIHFCVSEKMAPDDRDDRYSAASRLIYIMFFYICVGKEARGRLFVEALCWMARMGTPWRQLPAEYGKWNSVYRR